ncbi:hypothetical protein KR018_011008 [Drosophila ironensis]|nr:hypothetical protein KR018_011008 [Drosophila ironensis]
MDTKAPTKEEDVVANADVYPTNDDFFRLPIMYYRTIGVNPYESSRADRKKMGILSHILKVVLIANLLFAMSSEASYVFVSFRDGENFLESCMVMSYFAFSVVGGLKIIVVLLRKDQMTNLVRKLESIFPPPQSAEKDPYKAREYLKSCYHFTKGFGGLYTFLVFVYNLYPITQYKVLSLMHSANAHPVLPYANIALWDYRSGILYYLTYFSQSMAGYTATCGHISADLMIFAVTMQELMHIDRVVTDLRGFQVRARQPDGSFDAIGAEEDLQELRALVAYHEKILGMTDDVNEVFGIPLLINFVASSMLVCFVGFQMTFGVSPQHFLKLMLILSSSVVEIYLICSFSQRLVEASESISFAVYDMDWTGADVRFRKMLIYIAHRAQKPVCLKATVFLDISIETMSIASILIDFWIQITNLIPLAVLANVV